MARLQRQAGTALNFTDFKSHVGRKFTVFFIAVTVEYTYEKTVA
jgi:hypothetical protein